MIEEEDTPTTKDENKVTPIPYSLMKMAEELRKGVAVRTHSYHFTKYKKTFVGSEAVDFMVASNMSVTREDAVFLGQRLMKELNLFFHVCWDHTFKDGHYFYRFTDGDLEEDNFLDKMSSERSQDSTPSSSSENEVGLNPTIGAKVAFTFAAALVHAGID
jgi:hypothetical protein